MQGETHIQGQDVIPLATTDTPKLRADVAGNDTAKRLTQVWQELLGVEPIGLDQNYFDLGGDSSLAVQLFSRIASVFKVQLPLATLFDAPTIAELSEVLRHEVSAAHWSPMVAIQPLGSRPPFFCIHGAGGNVLIYRDLSRHLGPDQPFYGLQSQGLDGTSPPLKTIEEMAVIYVADIRKVCPHGPYYLGGYCMGGTVAFEVAQQLTAQGEQIALLALFDTMDWSKIPHASIWDRIYQDSQRLTFHLANFLCLDLGGMVKFFREKLEILGDRLPLWMGMLLGKLDPQRLRRTMPESRALGRLWQMNDRACVSYLPRPYPGKITDFRPRKQYQRFSNPEAKWEPLAQGGQEIIVLPVYPAGMLVEPFVKHLARALRDSIDAAAAGSH
ncbi:MAG: alpha/beta fold hydrolase [Terriglobales bacterium]|jgi:thioesterase domain-containing protein/acyl carrier protein|nr:alpha/beta fold hydrolase [Terriglobales bacterium]